MLLSKWDRSEFLANALALELGGAACDQEGVECDEAVGTATQHGLIPVSVQCLNGWAAVETVEQLMQARRIAIHYLPMYSALSDT